MGREELEQVLDVAAAREVAHEQLPRARPLPRPPAKVLAGVRAQVLPARRAVAARPLLLILCLVTEARLRIRPPTLFLLLLFLLLLSISPSPSSSLAEFPSSIHPSLYSFPPCPPPPPPHAQLPLLLILHSLHPIRSIPPSPPLLILTPHFSKILHPLCNLPVLMRIHIPQNRKMRLPPRVELNPAQMPRVLK